MQVLTDETKMNVKDLLKSFNTYDNLCALKADDDIDNIVCSDTSLNLKRKLLKNTYGEVLKNQISVAFLTSEKDNNINDNLSKTKKKNKKKGVPKKNISSLDERSWFNKKFEIEVGTNISKETVPFSTLEKDIIHRKRSEKEKHLYQEYNEAPRPDDIPDIVWNGPPLNCCFCISSMDNCDCKGDIVLPPRPLPMGIYWKFMLRLHYIHQKKFFKKYKLNIPPLPEKPFAERLKKHLEVEAVIQKQLNEADLNCGPEFCFFRCYNYHVPLASESSSYFKLKREFYIEYFKPVPVVVIEPPPPEPPSIADEIIDGLYRTVATQATTDENGEFIMGEVSHILFGNGNVLQDIEGTPYCVCTYNEAVIKKPEPMVKKMQNLLSISGIKKRVSNLTSNLMSSIVDIEDTGIPINTRATQDPPLDNYFESIIVPLKYKFVKVTEEEVCPCCKKYKELHTIELDQIESNVIDNYDNLESKGLKSQFNPQQGEQRQLGNYDHDNPNIVGKQILPKKDNLFSEAKKDVKHENECDVKNINDNIELLKRDLITDKPVKKYKSVDWNKDLYAIQSESMLNVDKTTKHDTGVVKGIDKKNNEMKGLDFLESIKPCCIDNLLKTLERKISNEKFVSNLLDQILRRVARSIYKRDQKRLQDLDNVNKEIVIKSYNNNIDTEIENDSAEACEKITKPINLKCSIKINMNKFSEFLKKQKSSLKLFIKKIQDARLRSRSRNAASLEEFKVEKNKSLKKMNKAVSSFFKRLCKKSSGNINQTMTTSKNNTNKVDSLDDSESKEADHSSPDTLQNIADIQNSNTSEKEVFCVQYNSTWDIFSKNDNQ